jgi:hypothetical protein
MADYSCEWCDKDKTCPYAYNSTSCEQKNMMILKIFLLKLLIC